jgi:hypothetical protein
MDDELPIDEVELLTRLGIALRDRWNALPLHAHRQIIERAGELDGWPEGMDVRKTLNEYLERNDPTDPDEA